MSSGPITLFDKSFIQGLSVDESVWFDNFFYSVVCPIFYVETLADLSKNMSGGRTAEREVAKIANKFPDIGGNPCRNHIDLVIGNLLGHHVPMDGRFVMPGGHAVSSGSRTGYVFKNSPEVEAFNRWQNQDFKSVERNFAHVWREAISNLDLKKKSEIFQRLGLDTTNCRDLEGALALAEKILRSPKPYDQMALAVLFLNIPKEYHTSIVRHWQSRNLPPIQQYAPYAAFVLKVEIFFQIAIASSLISADRPSNRQDISYLFYLPFCMLFVSSDKLHQSCAHLFLRDDQWFVWGPDLKSDLSKLDKRYSALPQEIKRLGVLAFAGTPPHDGNFLTTELWDRTLGEKWRDRPEVVDHMPKTDKGLVEELTKFSESEPISPEKVDFDLESADSMAIQRSIRRQKGKWLQVPEDLIDKKDE